MTPRTDVAMTTDAAFHFPPDVFDAVVDAVPLLTRSKRDVLLFFRGCGVSAKFLSALDQDESKYQLTRATLAYLNELDDRGLPQRREVLKRVSEWDNYTTCYPDNQLKAKGAVAAVAELINRKDSFTRLQQAHDDERKRHREAKDAEVARASERRATREQVQRDLYGLFGETDPHRRGIALEGVLNRLFASFDIAVRESFVVRGPEGDALEQIDGAVEIDGRLYLVEMKWWNKPLGRNDIAPHLVGVFSRGEAGGIMISASGFQDSAVEDCKTALAQRTVVLMELKELVTLLDRDLGLLDLLRAKIREATLSKRPLTYPLERI
jgi:restriction system protein